MRRDFTALVLAILILAAAPRVEAQGSLEAARELYASADYDAALAMLDGLLADNHPGQDQRSIEMYRVLCLVATRRDADAKGAIESLVLRNPLYRPSTELPPRVRATFDETRKRLLPSAVQGKYQEAKAAFDSKDYQTARRGFAEVLEVLADPDAAVLATQSPLSDVRVLASGFEELSAKAAIPQERPQDRVAAAPMPSIAPLSPPLPSKRTYSAADPNVVPPLAINQQIPAFPGTVRMARTGMVEVVIDDDGAVESATMLEPVNPQFDRLTLAATKDWRYQPATLDGVPVKFVKRIHVSIVPGR